MTQGGAKVSVIGCGNVGVRYAYALIIQGIARQLVMVDANRNRAEGEAMDLSHGAPFIQPVDIIAGDYSDMKDSDLVVITAGKKQKPEQSRLDLLKDNVALFRQIIPEVMRHAPEAKLLIATNPVDVLSYAAYKFSGKSAGTVMGSGTVLDSARFRFLLSKLCGVDARNIHAYILGEHGDTEFAAWSKAMIGGILYQNYCPSCSLSDPKNARAHFQQVFEQVRDSAYEIIKRKGETSYGIGLALVRITQAIFNDENAVLPVSSLVNGYLGIKDVYLSLPAVVNKDGIREVMPLELDSQEQQTFRNSAEKIKNAISEAGI